MLETIERARGHKELADLSAAQVEHIMPQTLNDGWVEDLGPNAKTVHEKWLHRPGNLTLSAYNQELWNHPFKKKRMRYADSNIVITRELSKYDQWDEAEIQQRGKLLADEAAKIWNGPKEQVSDQDVDENDEGPGRHELRQLFWTALGDYLSTEFSELPKVDVRDSSSIRVASGVRHIGLDLQFNLRHRAIGIDVWFWRDASIPIWDRISKSSNQYDQLFGTKWEFDKVEGKSRARMSIWLPMPSLRTESSWSDAQHWFGEKLTLIFEKMLPDFRGEIDQREAA